MAREHQTAASDSTRFEEDRSWENQMRCPGFKLVTLPKLAGPQDTLVRCTEQHPHQVLLRVVTEIDQRGQSRDFRYEIPRYPWTADLATEAEARERAERRDAWNARKQAERQQRAAEARQEVRRITAEEAVFAVTNAPLVLDEPPRPEPEDDGGYMGDDTLDRDLGRMQ